MKAAGVVLYNSARLIQHKQVANAIKITKSLNHQSSLICEDYLVNET